MFTSIEEIYQSLLAGNLPDDVARRISALSKPCVWLKTEKVKADSEIEIGAMKIGGSPDLPEKAGWPIRPAYSDAKKRSNENHSHFRSEQKQMSSIIEKPFPLAFIAQINLADAWAAGPLDPDFPETGIISIFYDILEQPWGFDPNDHASISILFHEDEKKLTRQKTPKELLDIVSFKPIEPLKCSLNACFTPLSVETATFDNLQLSSQVRDDYWNWIEDNNIYGSEDGNDWKCHRISGWPTPIQGDMQTECALVAAGFYCGNGDAYHAPEARAIRSTADDWILLAQIGSHDTSDFSMMWGDCGQLYIWIRKQDLKKRNFNAARLILQCY